MKIKRSEMSYPSPSLMGASGYETGQQKNSSHEIPPLTNIVPYTVKEGENLYGIALKHHMNHSQLRKLNGLFGSNDLYPGQVLLVFHVNSQKPKELPDSERWDKQIYICEPVQLCVKDEEFCRLVPGNLAVNQDAISFTAGGGVFFFFFFEAILALLKHTRIYNFSIDCREIDSCSVIPSASQNELDYVKIVWRSSQSNGDCLNHKVC